jgi:hypothetical protein
MKKEGRCVVSFSIRSLLGLSKFLRILMSVILAKTKKSGMNENTRSTVLLKNLISPKS